MRSLNRHARGSNGGRRRFEDAPWEPARRLVVVVFRFFTRASHRDGGARDGAAPGAPGGLQGGHAADGRELERDERHLCGWTVRYQRADKSDSSVQARILRNSADREKALEFLERKRIGRELIDRKKSVISPINSRACRYIDRVNVPIKNAFFLRDKKVFGRVSTVSCTPPRPRVLDSLSGVRLNLSKRSSGSSRWSRLSRVCCSRELCRVGSFLCP